nr:hypothetical protein [Frankia sp. Cj5]
MDVQPVRAADSSFQDGTENAVEEIRRTLVTGMSALSEADQHAPAAAFARQTAETAAQDYSTFEAPAGTPSDYGAGLAAELAETTETLARAGQYEQVVVLAAVTEAVTGAIYREDRRAEALTDLVESLSGARPAGPPPAAGSPWDDRPGNGPRHLRRSAASETP